MNLDPLLSCWHGSPQALELATAGLVSGGHLLIEGPPGTGKTHLSRLLAAGFGLETRGIQGTPDLMPSDVVGSRILQHDGQDQFREGPVFCNLLLIDEITRIASRTLSALLEAMQEGRVTVDSVTRDLPDPFRVIATRSTREFEGVYQLPEAATDRFLLSLRLSLPTRDEEFDLLTSEAQDFPRGCLGDLGECSRHVREMPVSDRLIKRAISLTRESRHDNGLVFGAGIRGSQALIQAARGLAWVRAEPTVTLDHLEAIALPVLSHRLRPVEMRMTTKRFVDKHWELTDPAQALARRFPEILS